jgi:excisionase family DNA binding protein
MSNYATQRAVGSGDSPAWISQSEAARLRRVSRQAIFDLKRKNRFRVLKVGNKTLLNRNDVETYQPRRAKLLSRSNNTKRG